MARGRCILEETNGAQYLVASFRWETNGAAAGVASSVQWGPWMVGRKHIELAGEARLAVEAGVVVLQVRLIGLLGSGFAGETAGESRTPAMAGVVDGGAYGRRSLVGGIDVATPTRFP